MALAAGISGAELIPDGAQLFLGFTSTQKAGLGPARIVNLETLGYADLGPSGYFAQGRTCTCRTCSRTWRPGTRSSTSRHAWTRLSGRASSPPGDADGRPGIRGRAGRGARPARLTSVTGESAIRVDSDRRPLASDVVGPDGTRYPKGNGGPAAGRLQHPRQPVLLVGGPGPRRHSRRSRGGSPLRGLQPHERRLSANAAGDGRGPPGGRVSFRAGKPRPRLQLGSRDDASAELPRAASRTPLVPPRRACR